MGPALRVQDVTKIYGEGPGAVRAVQAARVPPNAEQ
jgi:hypothetical protein